jgi:glycosyltransferase involved in cell wall biosynthesis
MSKYRVRLLYDVPGWAYHSRCVALAKYAPEDFEVVLDRGNLSRFSEEPFDLNLQLVYPHAGLLRQHLDRLGQKSIIVTGCNTGWFNENRDEGHKYFAQMQSASDWIVFNSRAAWGFSGCPDRTSWIANGVDREVFYPKMVGTARQPKVLWLGSEFHAQPHRDTKNYWSILIPLKARLEARGIACDFRRVDSVATVHKNGVGHYSQPELADWYNTGTVYVVASRCEGTPNPALEAAACGCTLVSTVVGNMPELIRHGMNGLFVDCTLDSVEAGVLRAIDQYTQWGPATLKSIESWDWRLRTGQYFDLFRRLIDEKNAIYC